MDKRDQIRRALAQAADIVAVHGPRYLPLFEALERDLDNLDQGAAAMSRALALAHGGAGGEGRGGDPGRRGFHRRRSA